MPTKKPTKAQIASELRDAIVAFNSAMAAAGNAGYRPLVLPLNKWTNDVGDVITKDDRLSLHSV